MGQILLEVFDSLLPAYIKTPGSLKKKSCCTGFLIKDSEIFALWCVLYSVIQFIKFMLSIGKQIHFPNAQWVRQNLGTSNTVACPI